MDMRGKLVETVHENFKKSMEHWKVENVTIHVSDDLQIPSKSIAVDHRRFAIAFEDEKNVNIFKKHSVDLINIVHNIFVKKIDYIRIGLRLIDIHTIPRWTRFEDVFENLKQKYYTKPIPLSVVLTDCQVRFNHSNGFLYFGPTKKSEDWVNSLFNIPETNVPDFGLGLDIDSFVAEPGKFSAKETINTFHDLLQASLSVENEIIKSLEE